MKDLEITNYEYNLKMHYEAKRKELDILLTSSITQQLSNMKTLLWMNFLMIGLMLQLIKKFPLPDTMMGFFILSLSAILSIMIAILTKRTKSYGVPDDIKYMSEFNDDEWTISKATLAMLNAANIAIKENRDVIVKRAELMHLSTIFTFVSMFFIFISFFLKQINL